MKTRKHVAALLSLAVFAVPAVAAAKGPNGDHGKSGEDHGKSQNHVSKRCKKQPKVGFTLHGTLDPSSTADSLVVVVERTNKHAKAFLTDGKFTVAVTEDTNVKYVGDNPFETEGADLSQYKVKVIGKVIKRKKNCDEENSPAPAIRKVVVKAPGSDDEQETEQETTEQEQTPQA